MSVKIENWTYFFENENRIDLTAMQGVAYILI